MEVKNGKVIHGDCILKMKEMPDNSVDSIVTDPPYGISFMGKEFDTFSSNEHYREFSKQWATEALRVLKPGGYMLSFSGTKTYHWMAVGIEQAGFDCRDMMEWVYGQGFPKSHDISKAIDKEAGAQREILSRRDAPVGFDTKKEGGGGWAAGEIIVTKPATENARKWDGFGTALKPAQEPIMVAQKPISEKTIAANCLKWGVGALNIDGCRIGTTENLNGGAYAKNGGRTESQSLHGDTGMNVAGKTVGTEFVQPVGRWPANVIHDGSPEVVELFPNSKDGVAVSRNKVKDTYKPNTIFGKIKVDLKDVGYGGSGSVARFFYCAKPSKRERNAGLSGQNVNFHVTVKPIELMRYLIRLVTPPEGTVMDPFLGSGTTALAAIDEDRQFIGIEKDSKYFNLAYERIKNYGDSTLPL